MALSKHPLVPQATSKPDLLSSSYASLASTLHCKRRIQSVTSPNLSNQNQSFLGTSPRTYNSDQLWSFYISRTVHLLCFSEHHTVHLCGPSWLLLPPLFGAQVQSNPCCLPVPLDPFSPRSRGSNLFTGLPVWIRFTRAHRLYNIYSCQIVQAPSRHVPPPHDISEIIPSLQIPCRGFGDSGCGSLHCLPSLIVKQKVISKEQQLSLGANAAKHQPPLRRPDE